MGLGLKGCHGRQDTSFPEKSRDNLRTMLAEHATAASRWQEVATFVQAGSKWHAEEIDVINRPYCFQPFLVVYDDIHIHIYIYIYIHTYIYIDIHIIL